MAGPRISAAALARLLNSAPQPIYVLDGDLAIVFLNQACRDWLGERADALLGQRCVYHSVDAGKPDGLAASLCPPPSVLCGDAATSTLVVTGGDGQAVERAALFTPLRNGTDSAFGVVAIVDEPVDVEHVASSRLSGGVASGLPYSGSGDGTALHEGICRFRREAAARYGADRLIGEGPAMQLARRQVELAAASRCGVLLVGPPGSGRQRLAAAIHYGSAIKPGGAVSAGTLLPLDCALLGSDFLPAAGAAITNTMGREPGTLLLHRVDELSAEVQVQLADLLMRRACAWRLIATAAEPLKELSRRGQFRDDLAALLSTITIELPPLAQRREDLPLLTQMFLEDCNAVGSRQLGGFSAAALERLDAYGWPGNLDELAEVVAESHRRAAATEIGVADLPERLHVAAQAAAHPRRAEETIVLDEYLARVERELIRRALGRAKGNKAKAARLLGVTRPRLYRRMLQLGLE